jgi:hypothetical protein
MESSLEKQFGNELFELYKLAKVKCNYNATRFFQMLHEIGRVATATQLGLSPEFSQGLSAMWECGRLDLTIKATF